MQTALPLLLLGLWCIASLLVLVGTAWLAVAAFQESLWWGVACAFLPPAFLAFMVLKWRRARLPAEITALGLVTGAVSFWAMLRTGLLDLEALRAAWETLGGGHGL